MKLLKSLNLLTLGSAAITHNGDGTGGSPPAIRHYVTVNGDHTIAEIGTGPHAADGIVTSDGGYVAVGIAMASELSQIGQGFAARIDPCPTKEAYATPLGNTVSGAGSNCATNFKWAWKQTNSDRYAHMVSVKESADGQHLLVAGTRQTAAVVTEFNGYVAKLNSATGALVWEFDFTTGAGSRSGFETIHFTSDGGFIVGGFNHRASQAPPGFKSGGQVDDGRPVFHKFSKATFDEASMVGEPTPVWTYNCKTDVSASCQLEDGSIKNMRVYQEGGVEKVVGLPTSRTILLILNTDTGAELAYSGDALTTGFVGDGTANDVEVEFDASGNVLGFVTTGLHISSIQTDAGVSCATAADGVCTVIVGTMTKYDTALTNQVWRQNFETGHWAGGVNQFATSTGTYKSLVYTECWGISKQLDSANNHIGYVAACGSGIEPGCTIHPGAIQTTCQTDPRAAWRQAVTSVDRAGNQVWYRLDSYQATAEETGLIESGESASEYIFQTAEGRVVSVTDEGFGGFGFLTYEIIPDVTTTVAPTTTTAATTTTTTTAAPVATTTEAAGVATTTVDAAIVPFTGSWDTHGGTVTIDNGGGVTFVTGETTMGPWPGTYGVDEEGNQTITFTDDDGNVHVGVLPESGNRVTFGNAVSISMFGEWTKSVTTAQPAVTTTASLGLGGIVGDPHVKVKLPAEEAVCFDVHPHAANVLLLSDLPSGLRITGGMERTGNKQRLAVIGVETKDGVQIAVHSDFIRINGVDVAYSHDQILDFDEVSVQIQSHLKSRHRGCILTFKSGPIVHVASKDSKESLKFEMVSSSGLSSTIGGVLGVAIRPHLYHIEDDGTIMVHGEEITDATRTWTEHTYCHVLKQTSVEKFLGHSIDVYTVPQLFVKQNNYASLVAENSPK